MTPTVPPVRVGTRGSVLARTQAGLVATALADQTGLPVELVTVRTEGDVRTGSLAALGGAGLFVNALRDAVRAGHCDVAVHSLKDLPTGPADDVELAAVPTREDPRDVLCARAGWTLATLPTAAVVGTGSPRRAAALRAARPDVTVVDLRGNVDTRLGRVRAGDLDAVVLARAGLARLGRLDAVTDTFRPEDMLPAPGQGALAVECRPGRRDGAGRDLDAALRALDDPLARAETHAERTLLAALEAGCSAPLGALARAGVGTLRLDAAVHSVDGRRTVRASGTVPWPSGPDPVAPAQALGLRVAAQLLADGAAELASPADSGGSASP